MSARNRRRNIRPAPSSPGRQDRTAPPPDQPSVVSGAEPGGVDPGGTAASRDCGSRDDPNRGDPLLAVLLTLLTPLLTAGNAEDAHRAAEQAVAAYRAGGQDQLVSVAQIVGFAVTSLDTLRLSMDADLSVPMKLRLRGNAAALSRSSHLATATLDNQRREAASPPAAKVEPREPIAADPDPDEAPRRARVLASLHDAQAQVRQAETALHAERTRQAEMTQQAAATRPTEPPNGPTSGSPGEPISGPPGGPAAGPPAKRTSGPPTEPPSGPPAGPSTKPPGDPAAGPTAQPSGLPSALGLDQRQRDLAWAKAMTDVAAEYSADMTRHSPAQRRIDLLRIGALARTASALSRGDVPLRSRLLGGTAIHG